VPRPRLAHGAAQQVDVVRQQGTSAVLEFTVKKKLPPRTKLRL